MHLESLRRQIVSIAGRPYLLEEGERVHTENSYKYTADGFRALAARGEFVLRRSWVDGAHGFGVFYLAVPQA